jgi:hypothetical protein
MLHLNKWSLVISRMTVVLALTALLACGDRPTPSPLHPDSTFLMEIVDAVDTWRRHVPQDNEALVKRLDGICMVRVGKQSITGATINEDLYEVRIVATGYNNKIEEQGAASVYLHNVRRDDGLLAYDLKIETIGKFWLDEARYAVDVHVLDVLGIVYEGNPLPAIVDHSGSSRSHVYDRKGNTTHSDRFQYSTQIREEQFTRHDAPLIAKGLCTLVDTEKCYAQISYVLYSDIR